MFFNVAILSLVFVGEEIYTNLHSISFIVLEFGFNGLEAFAKLEADQANALILQSCVIRITTWENSFL